MEMDMEALIKKPRPVSESAHQDLTNRSRLELIGHHLGALVIMIIVIIITTIRKISVHS